MLMNHNFYMRYEPQFSHEYGLSTYPLGVTCWAPVGNNQHLEKRSTNSPYKNVSFSFPLTYG